MTTSIDCANGVRLERRVPCRMSDGITLYADHYYPPHPGPQPTLLMRQPYGRDIASTVTYAHPAWFARHGYNVVIQDVRGRGDSEGTFYPFRHEARDGAETIAALRQRPESNGRVGMYGFSYQGLTQLLAAAQQPEGLACIAPAMAAHDLYHGWFYNGGALRQASTLGWGLQMLREDARRLNLREASTALEAAWSNLGAQHLITPYTNHPALSTSGIPTYVRDWIDHPTPGDFWSSLDLSTSVDKIQIPALHISGWYDTYLKGTIDCFHALRTQAGTKHARNNQYLLAGPWIHIPWADRIGPHPLGPAAALDTDALLLRWLNHWLKDTNEFAHDPPIRHYALNQNTWHSAQAFPTPSYTLYLHSQGRANSSKGDGTLSPTKPQTQQPPDLYIYDPEVPVPAPGGLTAAPGPHNQATLELGNNLLTYTTAPLEAELHIFGAPEITLHASSSAPNADLVIKLIHLHLSGVATFLTLGIARRTTRPDTPALWHIPLDPTSAVFAPGDRLRIEIASSAYPLFDRNPGTEIPPPQADPWTWHRSTQTIYHDPNHISALHLPVIPAEQA
jgi:putative CocE/NonD family hydrolase